MPHHKKVVRRKSGLRSIILVTVVFLVGAGALLYLTQVTQTNNSVGSASKPKEAIAQNQVQDYGQIPLFAVLGSNDAPVTILEFGEFQCPSCGYWVQSTQEEQIVKKLVNTGKARLVWKDFAYYGPDSDLASQAAYAAGEQGKFWDFYRLLYARQGAINSGWASKDSLRAFARELGLDMTKFDSVLEIKKYLPLVKSNFELGRKLGVTGTPTFFLEGPNGKSIKIVGAQPYEVFERAVNSLLGG